MAGKNPLLSWLFGSPPEEEPEEDQAPAEPQETAAPPRQEADPFRLDLPPDHAVNRLSRLWRERTGRYSPRPSASRGRRVRRSYPPPRPGRRWPGCC